ncbi:MAG: TetR/AcrR family transcriptional regulator [Pseudomonadota bacterium]|jgi:AcrR family transcriptional regulator
MGNKQTATQKQQTQDRAASEAALEAAALALLKRNGVLAGLNLREVADEAGVNRGLVYHYFGSRQQLLRSALRRDVKSRLEEILASGRLPFNARIRQLVRTMLGQSEAVTLSTLLLLDAQEKLPVAPLKEQWIEGFRKDVAEGKIAEDTDTQALLALMTALSYGYVVFRQAIAEELELPAADLDYRVDEIFGKMLGVFEESQS